MILMEMLEVVPASVKEHIELDTRDDDTTTYDLSAPMPAVDSIRQDVERLAYFLWQMRGCPEGSADEDWYRAEQLVRSEMPER